MNLLVCMMEMYLHMYKNIHESGWINGGAMFILFFTFFLILSIFLSYSTFWETMSTLFCKHAMEIFISDIIVLIFKSSSDVFPHGILFSFHLKILKSLFVGDFFGSLHHLYSTWIPFVGVYVFVLDFIFSYSVHDSECFVSKISFNLYHSIFFFIIYLFIYLEIILFSYPS